MAHLQETTISGSVTHKEGTVTTAGTTLTLDLSTGSSFEVDMSSFTNGIDTLTVLNKTDTNHNRSFLLQVTAHYVGGIPRIINWPGINNVKWPAGTSPVFVNVTDDDKKDIYSFTTWDNGTTWYARIIGQNY